MPGDDISNDADSHEKEIVSNERFTEWKLSLHRCHVKIKGFVKVV